MLGPRSHFIYTDAFTWSGDKEEFVWCKMGTEIGMNIVDTKLIHVWLESDSVYITVLNRTSFDSSSFMKRA